MEFIDIVGIEMFKINVSDVKGKAVLVLAHERSCPLCQEAVPFLKNVLSPKVDPDKLVIAFFELSDNPQSEVRPVGMEDVPNTPWIYTYRDGKRIESLRAYDENNEVDEIMYSAIAPYKK